MLISKYETKTHISIEKLWGRCCI